MASDRDDDRGRIRIPPNLTKEELEEFLEENDETLDRLYEPVKRKPKKGRKDEE